MVSAATTLRIQTVSRQINRLNLQQMLLSQKHQVLSQTSAEVGREYQKLYYQVNGLYGTVSAQQEDALTSKIQQYLPVWYSISDAENQLEMEEKALDTQLKALTEELKELEKAQENEAKNGAPKLSM